VRRPVVDQQFPIDPQADAVVGAGIKCVGFAVLRNQCAVPAHREVIGSHHWIGRFRAPFKIDLWVGSAECQILKASAIVVLRLQAWAGRCKTGSIGTVAGKVGKAGIDSQRVQTSRDLRSENHTEAVWRQLDNRINGNLNIAGSGQCHLLLGERRRINGLAKRDVDVVDSGGDGATGNMRKNRGCADRRCHS